MKKRSIARRLSLLIIALFAILFITYSVITNWISYGKNIANGENSTIEHTKLFASKLEKDLGNYKETLEISKQNIEALNEKGSLKASDLLTILHKNLEINSRIFSAGLVLEKGAMKVNPKKDANQLDDEGRYVAYLYRNKDEIKVDKGSGYEGENAADWYAVPKSGNRPILTEPYDYPIDGKTVKMSTFAVPLNDTKGKFIGVLTIDFPLDFAEDMVKEVKPDKGYAALISDNGTVLAHSANPKMVGTNMADAIDWKTQKDIINTGEAADFYVDSKTFGEKAFNSISPINIDGLDEKWSLQSVSPKSSILDTYNQLLKITIFSGILMIILMSAAALWFIYKQLKPLQNVKDAMELAAEGDLSVRIPSEQIKPDEIGAVSEAFNTMAERQSRVVEAIKQSTGQLNSAADTMQHTFEEVAASSNEVATAIDEIAQGASRQSEDTENTNEQINSLASQIDTLSALSDKMTALSDTASQSTLNGMEQVKVLKEQNETSNTVNETVQEQIETLSAKIGEINVITSSIQSLTEQTNLLALNASIEAARAGEHGKGFAVVADEVRKLAEQSRKQTEVIQTTVQDILQTSDATVESIGRNAKMREANDKSVTETEAAFIHNAKVLDELLSSIRTVATSLASMMEAKEEAILSLQSVTAISEQTAASAEEVSASANEQQTEMTNVADNIEKMNTIAAELEQVMRQFKTDD
ncbi:methyl-accepting chemotaxis protein [Aciduricibacillus chroicocephali]|uniref:Methyl-accepting chemotaxis protein n=1 Tax=Aciduricibacillus chroicocephali TaxID=3054939 RepID=A0ABY9KXK7_9BACI|nr:methyl-accepting chemotaxis protein [Bacillaceae bacterium 44XB]